jgi:hypothetical protein
MKLQLSGACAFAFILLTTSAFATGVTCPTGVDPTGSQALKTVTKTSGCSVGASDGIPLPDSSCTPGAVNPTMTLQILTGGEFKTGCERDMASSPTEKRATYGDYGITKPKSNTGKKQTCELDHLVLLEIGGADTVDNIWPQCGPKGAKLNNRFFKQKDRVENYVAALIKDGTIDTAAKLADYQHKIAEDWTQLLAESDAYWKTHTPHKFQNDQ